MQTINFGKVFSLALSVLLITSTAFAEANYIELDPAVIVTVNKTTCAKIEGNWSLVKRVGKNRYLEIKRSNKICRYLNSHNLSGNIDLTNLPGWETLPSVGSNQEDESEVIEAISGTPPPLSSFFGADVRNIFWRSGVVDAVVSGTATPVQCSEFNGSNVDGVSGGLMSCYLAESLGKTYEALLGNSNSFCAASKVASQSLLTSNALRVSSGTLPSGGITKLFAFPTPTPTPYRPGIPSRPIYSTPVRDRTVKIEMTQAGSVAQTMYVNVKNPNDTISNRYNAFLYSFDVWLCKNGQLKEYRNQEVQRGGGYTTAQIQRINSNGEIESARATGFLARLDGQYTFNDSPVGTISVEVGNRLKYNVMFNYATSLEGKYFSGDAVEVLSNKTYLRNFEGRYTGNNLNTVSLFGGAIRELTKGQDIIRTIGTEYRTSYYASIVASSILNYYIYGLFGSPRFESYFFASAPNATFRYSDSVCQRSADVTLTLDLANDQIVQIMNSCSNAGVANTSFCNGDANVNAARIAHPNLCLGAAS